MGAKVKTNSDTAGALFYTAFPLKFAISCVLTASLKQSVQETLVNLFISTENRGKTNQLLQIKRFYNYVSTP